MIMYPFVDVILKLERRSRKYRFYMWVLNLTVFFLLDYALLLYISAPVIFARYSSYDFMLLEYPVRMKMLCTAITALIPAIAIAFLLRRKPVNILKSIEDRYPVLRERLSTAYDNINSTGIVVNDLVWRVSSDITSVRESAIVSRRGLSLLMVISIGLASLVLFMSSPDAPHLLTAEQVESMTKPADETERAASEEEAHYQQLMTELGSESGAGAGEAQIYGKPSVAVIEGTNIELVMFPDTGTGHRARRVESEPMNFISGAVYGATPVSSETYIDKLPEENRDLIKQYFMEMADAG